MRVPTVVNQGLALLEEAEQDVLGTSEGGTLNYTPGLRTADTLNLHALIETGEFYLRLCLIV